MGKLLSDSSMPVSRETLPTPPASRADAGAAEALTLRLQPRLGLYVHWPFCATKCPYCDFNSHVARSIDAKAWLSAYRRSLALVAEPLRGRVLHTVFFGGGTPSTMPAELVGGILAAARDEFVFANDIEVTLEANPSSSDVRRFDEFRSAGVNRASVGVQALDDDALRLLGRTHSVLDAINAVRNAASIFPRCSFDLICARQHQSLNSWSEELHRALDLGAKHMSLYQLTVEPGTVFGDRYARGQLRGLPDENLSADMYALTQEVTAQYGLSAYEVSNHASHGEECRHNLIYWNSEDWIGIGPGAHGRMTIENRRHATVHYSKPAKWLDAVGSGGTGEESRTPLSTEETVEERLFMGLRLTNGIALDDLGEAFAETTRRKALSDMIDSGHLMLSAGRIQATASGRMVLNAVLRLLLA